VESVLPPSVDGSPARNNPTDKEKQQEGNASGGNAVRDIEIRSTERIEDDFLLKKLDIEVSPARP
jgi:hypothetical protein